MGGLVKDVESKEELEKLLGSGATVIVHFWAEWCDASKHMNGVFSKLSSDFPNANFFSVEAEKYPEISDAYDVSAVPCFLFFKGGKRVDVLQGADPSGLANKISEHAVSINPNETGLSADPTGTPNNTTNDPLNQRLQNLINSHPLMLFMKGTREAPRCGFSQNTVEILEAENTEFGTFDILSNNTVREELKKLSNWPTYPQLYCRGELLGGSDIIIEMHQSGELKTLLNEKGIPKNSLEDRLRRLISSSPVMLFMKGTPSMPRCGFSQKVVSALNKEGIPFKSFDILEDEEVRQGLKVWSKWPTFPQLYYKGELVGGCDIVMELQTNGELRSTLSG